MSELERERHTQDDKTEGEGEGTKEWKRKKVRERKCVSLGKSGAVREGARDSRRETVRV